MMWLSLLWRDLRFGLRNLGKDLRFSGLAILTLGLGIGAATAIFSVLDSAVLDPFPFKDPERLVRMYVHDVTRPKQDGTVGFTIPELLDFREQNHVFEDVSGVGGTDVLYDDGKETLLFQGCWVTPNTFDFLGVPPLLGRWITEDDAKPDAPPVFAMSYRLWTKQFNQDPKILGTTMTLNGERRTLVAIMPPRFLYANGDIYIEVPWSHADVGNPQLGGLPIYLLGAWRLKRGVSMQAAVADFDVLARREAQAHPKDFPKQFTIRIKTQGEAIAGSFATMLYLLMAAAFLLLLIACSNVANLLLARATVREKEIAIRRSVGASRIRIVLQLLVESFVLAIAGCGVGCLISYAAVRAVAVTVPPGWFAYEAVIEMKPLALFFAVGVAMLTTVLSGLAPAIHAVSGSLATRLTDSRGASGSFRHGKFRSGLVVVEVALSIVTLLGAGLMMRSLFALEHVDLGFDAANVLTARIPFPAGRYQLAQQKQIFFDQVLARVMALPGVTAATETTNLPPYGGPGSEITITGKVHSNVWNAQLQFVSEGYFRTLGIEVLRGSTLSAADVESARHVIVVNETLARNYFKDEDPVGKTIKFNFLDQIPDAPHDTYFQIVGIVRDSKNQGLQESPAPAAFTPYTITGIGSRGILVRTATDPLSTLPSLRQAVASVDSSLPLTQAGSLDGYLQQFSYAQPQFGLIVMAAFAGIGLLLVVVGVFSVMAYTVSLQTHEIGIRMALGAQRESILRMVLRRGLLLITAGIVLGLLMSFALMRVVANQFWGVSASDPWTFSTVVVAILVVGLAACFFPAQRATKVDPMVALRYE